MMRNAFSSRVGLLLAVLLGGAGGCGDVDVVPLGCAAVRSGPVCELDSARSVRLFVKTQSPKSQVSILQNGWPLKTQAQEVAGGLLFRLTVSPGERSLRVLDRSAEGWRSRAVELRPLELVSWVKEARRLWESDKGEDAAALLTLKLDEAGAVRDRAAALWMLGRIRREQGNHPEAERLLGQALERVRSTGLWSDESTYAFSRVAFLIEEQHRLQEALEVLDSRRETFLHVPGLLPWVALQRATIHRQRGELTRACELIDEGQALARQLGEELVQGTLHEAAAQVLMSLGRWQEARDELSGLVAERGEGEPCLKADALELRASLEVAASEAGQPAKMAEAYEALQEALQLRRERCRQVGPTVKTLTKLSAAAVLRGEDVAAAEWLAQARTEAQKEAKKDADGQMELQWIDLMGQIELLRGDAPAAEKQFRELLRRRLEPGALAQYDLPWRGYIGLAKALRRQARWKEAADYFALAERALAQRSLDVPLADGRVSYCAKHEQGIAAYLELLLEQGRLGEAMQRLRLARVRGLRDLRWNVRLEQLGDAERGRWMAASKQREAIRTKLDLNLEQAVNAPESQVNILADEKRKTALTKRNTKQTKSTPK